MVSQLRNLVRGPTEIIFDSSEIGTIRVYEKTKWRITNSSFDDIFDKLDETRVQKIVTMVNDAVLDKFYFRHMQNEQR